jgi:hypothetical protein
MGRMHPFPVVGKPKGGNVGADRFALGLGIAVAHHASSLPEADRGNAVRILSGDHAQPFDRANDGDCGRSIALPQWRGLQRKASAMRRIGQARDCAPVLGKH